MHVELTNGFQLGRDYFVLPYSRELVIANPAIKIHVRSVIRSVKFILTTNVSLKTFGICPSARTLQCKNERTYLPVFNPLSSNFANEFRSVFKASMINLSNSYVYIFLKKLHKNIVGYAF